jgi:hypothetical protein
MFISAFITLSILARIYYLNNAPTDKVHPYHVEDITEFYEKILWLPAIIALGSFFIFLSESTG